MKKQGQLVKRYPVQIGNWKVNPKTYNLENLLDILYDEIKKILKKHKQPGIFLSGGIDSTVLVMLVKEYYSDIPCFTIGNSTEHLDVSSALRFAQEMDLNHRIYIPKNKDILEVKKHEQFPGDGGVYLALKFASEFCNNIIAADGIDEQMGGYWWHVNRNNTFPTIEKAFKHFWDELELKHLTPMFNSAKIIGINIDWIYLHKLIVNYISRIPLEDRVKNNTSKALWKEFAKMIGIPKWVIERKKKGFCDALD